MTARGYELDDALRAVLAQLREMDIRINRNRPSTGSSYSGTGSGSASTNVQDAIDELFVLLAAAALEVTDGTVTVDPATTLLTRAGGVENVPAGTALLHLLTSRGGDKHDLVTVAAAGATYDIDCSLANVFDLTLTANLTYTISNPPTAALASTIYIIFRQGGAGSYTVTHPAAVKWQAADGTNTGTAPTLHTAVGALNIIGLTTLDGGTSWGGADEAGGSGAGGTPATTVESETAFGITPAVGTDTEYARQDHTHGSPANPVSGAAISAFGFVGQILISDTPSTPLVFADLIQNEAQTDLVYADV